jgi:HD-GYP domain-containing protein (c-di-GMP phosphodiesterase class II)
LERIPLNQVKEGMLVGQTIYNDQENVLLAKGTPLTHSYITALANRGFQAIYVQDGIGDDVLPEEALPRHIRQAVGNHLRELFSVAVKSGSASQRGALANLKSHSAQMMAIYRDVKKIVEEVMDADSLSGVVSIKCHDNYTFEHSVEVTVTGVILGKRLNLPEWDLHQLALGCLWHDVGKTTVPVEILNKPGQLTAEEFDLVKQHSSAGYDAARKFMKDDDIIARSVVWQHHERQDGSGYPQGLRGTNSFDYSVPRQYGWGLMVPAAEIAAVADVYSALASDRPYRPATDPVVLAQTMRDMAGYHLNSEVVTGFLSVLPLYPVGTKVAVTSGRLNGCIGVVTDQNPLHMDRPMVRIVASPAGRMVAPVEVDTSREKGIELAMASPTEIRRLVGATVGT